MDENKRPDDPRSRKTTDEQVRDLLAIHEQAGERRSVDVQAAEKPVMVASLFGLIPRDR